MTTILIVSILSIIISLCILITYIRKQRKWKKEMEQFNRISAGHISIDEAREIVKASVWDQVKESVWESASDSAWDQTLK